MLNPFKMAGNMGSMVKHAMTIKNALEKEEYEVVQGNIRIVINGNQNVKVLEVDGASSEQMKRAVNDAIKKAQMGAAGKLGELSKQLGME